MLQVDRLSHVTAALGFHGYELVNSASTPTLISVLLAAVP
jgi:hypothetical protein